MNNLSAEREALLDIPNVYSYQASIDSDKAGYLIRQWVASNLYDRIRWALPSNHVCTFGFNSCPQYAAFSEPDREKMDILPVAQCPTRRSLSQRRSW